MRRPQPASGLVAVISSLLVALTSVAPVGAAIAPAEPEPALVLDAARKPCTAWTSTYAPPPTVRVLRTASTEPGPEVDGTVQTVDYYEYVATVMAAEWPERYPIETLKAGAIATKQYAWYHILHPRGKSKWKDGTKYCYDVVDNTIDQWYRPERYGPGTPLWPAEGSKIREAMDGTWDQSLRKYFGSVGDSSQILTGYRSGSSAAACGQDATGFKLFHHSTRKCGYDGLKYREILYRYLRPRLEIVTPGRNDIIGTVHGDVSAMEQAPGLRTPRVWTPGRPAPEPGSSAGIALGTEDLVDYTSGDMNGDGRRDLVWLRRTGPNVGTVTVALSDGVNYAAPEDWWTGDTLLPINSARLLVGDFQADGREDVAFFGEGPTAGTSRMVVLKRKKFVNPTKLFTPVQWWVGDQALEYVAGVWLGDLSGDGRSDLIVRQNIDTGGVRVKTAVTRSPLPASGPRMGVFRTRWEDPSVAAGMVKMTVADANRDGRDDMLLLIGRGGRVVVERLQGLKLGGFKRVRVWAAPRKDRIPVARTRLGAADIDYDGRTDLVLFSERGSGTRIRILKTRYSRMLKGPDWQVPFAWDTLRPF